MPKGNNSTVTVVRETVEDFTSLVAYDEDAQSDGRSSSCRLTSGDKRRRRCEQLCFSNPNGYECACATGEPKGQSPHQSGECEGT